MLNFLFFGAPVGLYVVLVALPRGRPALKGAIFIATGLVLLWLGLSFGAISPELETVGFVGLLALSAAWFIASTLQVLRIRLPDTAPGWIWPLCAILTFCVVTLVAMRFFGL
ncbi:MAG: hypothetical protein AAF922_09340 [Pseudomonadota bacterium]